MDPRVQEILDNATDIQRRYIRARLTHDSASKAAKAIGLAPKSPYNWDDLDVLEEAVKILLIDTVEATKEALVGLSLEAVEAIRRALTSKNHSAAMSAAKIIFNRIGLPAVTQMHHEGTGEGGAIPIITEIVFRGPDGSTNTLDDE